MELTDMSVTQALKVAREAGITLGVDGDHLTLEAAVEPPSAILELLSRHKLGILELLAPDSSGWSTGDWEAYFEKRAALAQHDGGFGRLEAELIAFEDCVDRWIVKNPPAVAIKNFCTLCGRAADNADAKNISIAGGSGATGILHGECAPQWFNQTRWQARRALMWLYQRPRLSHP